MHNGRPARVLDHSMDELRGGDTVLSHGRLTKFHVGKHKSFADDLNMERGTVSMRVALRYDLLRFILCSRDLYHKS